MVKNYYFVKHLYPEIFQNLNPQSVKNVFDDGILNILNGVDYYGRKIVLFKPGETKVKNRPLCAAAEGDNEFCVTLH